MTPDLRQRWNLVYNFVAGRPAGETPIAPILTFALRNRSQRSVIGPDNIRQIPERESNHRHKVLCECRGLFPLSSSAHFRTAHFCLWATDRLDGVRQQSSVEPSREPETGGVSMVPGCQDRSGRNISKRRLTSVR